LCNPARRIVDAGREPHIGSIHTRHNGRRQWRHENGEG
jgi:hypothetical protein